MASEKNSRLINLVIALLATKKYLTKPQIFKAVEGYEGSPEAADRMFERDKEELRALGIEIEMKSIDPLFEDEIGYRIRPERYRIDLGSLTSEEIGTLAIAAEAWRNTAFEDVARSTALRLESLGVAADFAELPTLDARFQAPELLFDLISSIEAEEEISINYFNINNELEVKQVAPHGIYSRGPNWYLYALDINEELFKSYRLDRIEGEIKRSKRKFVPREFTLPETHFPSISTVLEIRRDTASELMSKSHKIDEKDDWIKVKCDFESETSALTQILKNTPNVKVIEPETLLNKIKQALDQLVRLHELQ